MPSNPVVHVVDDDDAARDALMFLLSSANFLVHAYNSPRHSSMPSLPSKSVASSPM